MSKEILLNLASSYFMLARILKAEGLSYKHYLVSANDCLKKYRLLDKTEIVQAA